MIHATMITELEVQVEGQGLFEITDRVQAAVMEHGIDQGLCTVFIAHTSASLTVQENADPSARTDLERWFQRLVPEDDPLYTHTHEGPDDMPSHIKSALTSTSIGIPVLGGRLALGTWQGLYLFEHRHQPGNRRILLHLGN